MRLAARKGAEGTQRIAGWRLDLDDVRAQVGQEFRGVRRTAGAITLDDA